MRPYLLLSFLFLYQFVNAQYKISGFIYDENSSLLTNTEVLLIIDQTTKSVKSDQLGKYKFTNLSNGEYKLILKKGSRNEEFNVTVEDQDQEIDIGFYSLSESESVLDDLVINIESVKSKLEKEGFAMNVIETKYAALRNIQTNELLDRTAGIRVRQNGGLGASVNYNLNGMAGNSVRIFVDGIPISSYGPSFSLNSIPPSLIERIEVYKGVVPVHLSDDALGGAINIVLKKALGNSFNASVSYGSFNTFQSNFNGTFRNSKTGFTLKTSGFYNYSDNDYEMWGKFMYNFTPQGNKEFVRAKRFNDAYRSYGGRIEAGFTNVKWADRFFVGYNGSDDYNEIQHGIFMTVPYKGRFTESNSHVFNLDYHKKNLFTKGLTLDLNTTLGTRIEVINDTVKWRYNWYNEIVKGLYGEDLKTTYGGQQVGPTLNTIERKSFNIRVGLSYNIAQNHRIILNHILSDVNREESDLFKTSAQREYEETRKLQKNITSLGYEMHVFDNRLKVNVFSKFYNQKIHKIDPTPEKAPDGTIVKNDIHSRNEYNVTGYGLATSYLITPSVVFLFSAEKAVRLPTDDEIFGRPGENIIGSVLLKPEISDNYNVGLKLGPYKIIEKHKFSVSGSGFIRDTKDKLVQQGNTRLNEATGALPLENLGVTRAIGFEAELNYTYNDNLNISLNMSKFSSLYYMKHDGQGRFVEHRYKEQLPNEPFYTINAGAQYMLNNIIQKKSTVNLYYNFGFVESFYTIWALPPNISNRVTELENAKAPRQFIHDLGVSYAFPSKQFVLSVDVKNVFNRQAFDNFGVQKPGRGFYVKLNYLFNKF